MFQAPSTMIDARSGAFIISLTKKPSVCCQTRVPSYKGIVVEATFQDDWTKKSTKAVNGWFADEEKRSNGGKNEREPHVNNKCEIGWIPQFDGIDTAPVIAMDSATPAEERFVEAQRENTRRLDDMEAPSEAFVMRRHLK